MLNKECVEHEEDTLIHVAIKPIVCVHHSSMCNNPNVYYFTYLKINSTFLFYPISQPRTKKFVMSVIFRLIYLFCLCCLSILIKLEQRQQQIDEQVVYYEGRFFFCNKYNLNKVARGMFHSPTVIAVIGTYASTKLISKIRGFVVIKCNCKIQKPASLKQPMKFHYPTQMRFIQSPQNGFKNNCYYFYCFIRTYLRFYFQ